MGYKVLLLFSILLASAAGDSARMRFRPRIVGGIPIDITEAPFQVSLMLDGGHTCGGSIISPEWILTAAHCVDGATIDRLSIRAGSTLKSRGGAIRQIEQSIVHPEWRESTNEPDVALLKLASPLVLDDVRIATIELEEADAPEPAPGTRSTVTGWGLTLNRLQSNRVLRSTDVPIVSRSDCSLAYQSMGPITEHMICAGFIGGGHDACQNDSGGPLVVDGVQVGITSWGSGCARAGFPGVSARVALVRDWIREQSGI